MCLSEFHLFVYMFVHSFCTHCLHLMYVIISRPELIDMPSLSPDNAIENLENAFSVAETELGVTRLLDPEGDVLLVSSVVHISTINDHCFHRCQCC